MDGSSIYSLPEDALHQIFSYLSFRQIVICRSVSRLFHQILTSRCFMDFISTMNPPFRLLALRPPHQHQQNEYNRPSSSILHAFDLTLNRWIKFPLSISPYTSPQPIASSGGIVYFWAETPNSTKSLIACNPLSGLYRLIPNLGSAWSRHGSVLVELNRVLVVSQLATLYYSGSGDWLKFSSNLPSKPRSPVLVSNSVYALCDVGSPWRSQWKLFHCGLEKIQKPHGWNCLEKKKWGEVLDILKRPRLIRGCGSQLLMVGGLRSALSLNALCSTVLILKLDLETLEWEEADRMPPEMFQYFFVSSKFKVFGSGRYVCFSAKRLKKLAMWESSEELGVGKWSWIESLPGNADGLCRGFVFDAHLSTLP